jgi:hypothetical protein
MAPEVAFSWRVAPAEVDRREISDDRISVSLARQWAITVVRDPPTVTLELPEAIPAAAIVHPYSTVCLSVLARWRGDLTLHGGAFFHAGSAWALCGDRTAGKSTMLALLATRGIPIVADDLIVVKDRVALAGPHCVDLRLDAAERFPEARSMGVLGTRERFRLTSPPAPARAPLAGMFVLEWGEGRAPEIEPLSLKERLRALYEHQYTTLFPKPDERIVLELLDLPMWRLRRPKDWARADAATDALLATASAAG